MTTEGRAFVVPFASGEPRSPVGRYELTPEEAGEYRRLVAAQVAAADEYGRSSSTAAVERSWLAADDLSAFEDAIRARLGADDLGFLEVKETGVVSYVYRLAEVRSDARP